MSNQNTMTTTAGWPKANPMTRRLNTAIGIIQGACKNANRHIAHQLRACDRHAAKYGWDDDYRVEAAVFCIVQTAREILAVHARGEKIKSPDRFVKARLALALKLDRHGNLIIPRWKRVTTLGNRTSVTFATSPADL